MRMVYSEYIVNFNLLNSFEEVRVMEFQVIPLGKDKGLLELSVLEDLGEGQFRRGFSDLDKLGISYFLIKKDKFFDYDIFYN
jgi:hypothetical protein